MLVRDEQGTYLRLRLFNWWLVLGHWNEKRPEGRSR
jgi:hypothetical protein